MAELVDALDLGSSDENRGGSSPSARTSLICGVLAAPGRHPKARIGLKTRRWLNDASHRNPLRGPQARIQGRRSGERSRDRVSRPACRDEGQVRINGFRPGKVPVAHLKRLYGRAVMAEMIEQLSARPIARSSRTMRSSSPWSRRSTFRRTRTSSRRPSKASPISPTRSRSRCCRRFEIGDFDGRQARTARRRCPRRGGRRCAAELADAKPPLYAEGSEAAGRERRPATIDFVGKIDGEAVRRRERARTSIDARRRRLHSRASRISSSAWRPAKSARSTSPSRRIIGDERSPARRPTST